MLLPRIAKSTLVILYCARCVFAYTGQHPWGRYAVTGNRPSSLLLMKEVSHADIPAVDKAPKNASAKKTIVLPIFPLRKKVRFPTEKLQLNLYEERYLELAEYVLQENQPGQQIFGALYASNKPHVVKRGTGPIVPMIEPGDVGVVFLVDNSEEELIPTVGGIPRRRIRLDARGGARFQITSILQDGCESSSSLPFILVEANVYLDRNNDSEYDNILQSKQLEERLYQEKHPSLFSFIGRNREETSESLDLSLQQLYQFAKQIVFALDLPCGNRKKIKDELVSFALLASQIPAGKSRLRQDFLMDTDFQSRVSQLE